MVNLITITIAAVVLITKLIYKYTNNASMPESRKDIYIDFMKGDVKEYGTKN